MKKFISKLISFFKSLFLRLRLHFHVEAVLGKETNEEKNNQIKDSDDPEVKE